ncbi:TIGR03016 family PEP-CTERM system-associated outer membrane protein [Thiorhodococcus mannitoliphagus]|uniref:TIGR03016 family PEP-CTERM system-associated outer membrane protein n=1 Tax=Thiorhodococcus mannitoliphagus TaxID=329406 RepID=UPI001F110E42|nr:TIGR03016 family PEP-CTERM system-associated outer membrane protein [Thiorhodococcus mannitoliphagus]
MSKQLTVKGTYTDNLNLEDPTANDGAQGDFFIQLTPGFVLQANGRRLDLDVAYSLQSLHYLSYDSEDQLNNRLQANANSELYRDHLFLDMKVTARQELINAQGPTSWDATGPSNNLQTTYSYLVAPYFKNRFGRTAELTLRFEQNGVFYSDEGQDSLGYGTQLDLLSGPILGDLQLGLFAENANVDYQDGPSDRFSRAAGGVGYQIDERWRFDVLGGYEDNNYPSLDRTSGSLWESLLTWTPNVRTKVTAGVGQRYYGWTPRFELSYRRKRSVWTASYQRDLTSARGERANSTVYSFEDAFGEPVTPETGSALDVPLDTATVSSSVYVNNTFTSVVTVQTRRSTLGASLGYGLRQYQDVARDDEETLYARVYWSRRLAARTSLNLGLGWRQTDNNNSTDDTAANLQDSYYFNTGLTRQLSERTYCDLQYSFRDDSDNGAENRITLGLRISWE